MTNEDQIFLSDFQLHMKAFFKEQLCFWNKTAGGTYGPVIGLNSGLYKPLMANFLQNLLKVFFST